MYQGLRGKELQSNCLSSENLKEEMNNSLNLNATLIPLPAMFILKRSREAFGVINLLAWESNFGHHSTGESGTVETGALDGLALPPMIRRRGS